MKHNEFITEVTEMKKWYVQIGIAVTAMIIIGMIGDAIYPPNLYNSMNDVMKAADTRAFYVIAISGVLAQVLFLVGIVRGLLVLIRKFRSFVRIDK